MDQKKEIWKGVTYGGEYYGDFYEVSNLGGFRNAKTKKPVKTRANSKGYLMYCGSLGKSKKQKNFRIHKAVAETFVENPLEKPFVNHIDGDKNNNAADNLEWVTNHENILHAHETGLVTAESYEKSHIPQRIAVTATDITSGATIEFESSLSATKFLIDEGICTNIACKRHITECCQGKRKTAYGFMWEYCQ